MAQTPSIRPEEVTSIIRQELEKEGERADFASVGTVLQVGDGIARVYGIDDCVAMELLEFPGAVMGIAMNLEEHNIGCVLMGSDEQIGEGDPVKRTRRIASVPAGDALLGRVVDAVGRPLDGRGPIQTQVYRPLERVAPGIVRPGSRPITSTDTSATTAPAERSRAPSRQTSA